MNIKDTFERIKNYVFKDKQHVSIFIKLDFDDIEKALDEYEQLKYENEILKDDIKDLEEKIEELEEENESITEDVIYYCNKIDELEEELEFFKGNL